MMKGKNVLLAVGCLWIGLLTLSLSNGASAQIFLCDTITPKSEPALFVSAIQLRECLEEIDDIEQADLLVQVLSMDAVKYFELNRFYDTEDKLNAFKQTKAYKDSLAVLEGVKKEKLNTFYYSELTNDIGKFSWSFKGFKFAMDKLSTPGGTVGAPPPPSTMYYHLDFSKLPYVLTPPVAGQQGAPDQDMMLVVDPESGMKIDKDKANVKVIVLYKLDAVTTKDYAYYNAQCRCNRNAKENVITTKFNRVIIFNLITNEVYFDKTY